MTLATREHTELGVPVCGYSVKAVLKRKPLRFKVFMKRVSLAGFLKMIKFVEEDQASGDSVTRAFEECAKRDKELGFHDPVLVAIGKEPG
jgi:hypothetical protein